MDNKTFEMLLDLLGTNFADWPPDSARLAKRLLVHSQQARMSYDTLRRIETMIGSSRPRVAQFRADKVVQRALLETVRRDAHPTLIQRIRLLLLAPVPQAALAVTIAGIGFAAGLAIGNPSDAATDNTNGALMMTASADDVLF